MKSFETLQFYLTYDERGAQWYPKPEYEIFFEGDRVVSFENGQMSVDSGDGGTEEIEFDGDDSLFEDIEVFERIDEW